MSWCQPRDRRLRVGHTLIASVMSLAGWPLIVVVMVTIDCGFAAVGCRSDGPASIRIWYGVRVKFQIVVLVPGMASSLAISVTVCIPFVVRSRTISWGLVAPSSAELSCRDTTCREVVGEVATISSEVDGEVDRLHGGTEHRSGPISRHRYYRGGDAHTFRVWVGCPRKVVSHFPIALGYIRRGAQMSSEATLARASDCVWWNGLEEPEPKLGGPSLGIVLGPDMGASR